MDFVRCTEVVRLSESPLLEVSLYYTIIRMTDKKFTRLKRLITGVCGTCLMTYNQCKLRYRACSVTGLIFPLKIAGLVSTNIAFVQT